MKRLLAPPDFFSGKSLPQSGDGLQYLILVPGRVELVARMQQHRPHRFYRPAEGIHPRIPGHQPGVEMMGSVFVVEVIHLE